MKNTSRNTVICLTLSLITPPAALAETPAVPQECTDINARYTMDGAEDFELHFEKANDENDFFTPVQLVLTTPKGRYVLGFSSSSGGYWENYLTFSDDDVPQQDRGSFPFYRFDADLNPIEDLPGSDTPAAPYYFMPELSAVLWYHVSDAEILPKNMWHLEYCR